MGKSFWTSQRSSWRAWVTCYESCRLTGHSQETFLMNTRKKAKFLFCVFFSITKYRFSTITYFGGCGEERRQYWACFLLLFELLERCHFSDILTKLVFHIWARYTFFRRFKLGFVSMNWWRTHLIASRGVWDEILFISPSSGECLSKLTREFKWAMKEMKFEF